MGFHLTSTGDSCGDPEANSPARSRKQGSHFGQIPSSSFSLEELSHFNSLPCQMSQYRRSGRRVEESRVLLEMGSELWRVEEQFHLFLRIDESAECYLRRPRTFEAG
jgi:hypothetical protein